MLEDTAMILIDDKPKVLAIGAHSDDIILGAAGLLLRLIREFEAEFHLAIMTDGLYRSKSDSNVRQHERRREALKAVKILLGPSNATTAEARVHFGQFEDCGLSNVGHELIRSLENLLARLNPNIILTHAPEDFHDDHRQTHNATLSAARSFHGSVLFYQAPTTMINFFTPNFFVSLSPEDFQKKFALLQAHSSQADKGFMSYHQIDRISQAWAGFHRLGQNEKLEAFMLFKSFWR
jgi:LmbE family N-acetylglucosaminyl deacetylase